jgi:hypothetical protein
MTDFITILIGLLVLPASLIVHEAWHWIPCKLYGASTKFYITESYTMGLNIPDDLPYNQMRIVLLLPLPFETLVIFLGLFFISVGCGGEANLFLMLALSFFSSVSDSRSDIITFIEEAKVKNNSHDITTT